MAPEHASVFVIEDDPGWQTVIREQLERGGHNVVGTATSLEEAQALIPTLEGAGVQVAVVDGNLAEDHHNGIDGILVVRQIREEAPGVRTVGASLDPKGVLNADANVWKLKTRQDADLLARTVTEL